MTKISQRTVISHLWPRPAGGEREDGTGAVEAAQEREGEVGSQRVGESAGECAQVLRDC